MARERFRVDVDGRRIVGWYDPATGQGYSASGGLFSTAPGTSLSTVTSQVIPVLSGLQRADRRSGGAASDESASATQTPSTSATTPTRNFAAEAALLYPYLPGPLRDIFVAAWIQYGDASLAMQVLRQDARYEEFFPGNRRPDGSVYLAEAEWLSTMEGYRREMSALGYDPSRFEHRMHQAIARGKSVDEFTDDLTNFTAGVLSRGDAIRNFYATNFGTGDLSDVALIDSALSGESPLIMERRIRSSQIGGEAAGYGFSLARQQAERLEMLGLDQQAARGLFSKAQSELPTIQQLLVRHNDPDDAFTLDEYADAVVLQSPEQLAQIRRLYAQNAAGFSSRGSWAADDSGRLVGLRQR